MPRQNPDSAVHTIELKGSELGLLRVCLRLGHEILTSEARAELRMIEAEINGTLGGDPQWNEAMGPLDGGSR
jgi:hypothetical protein